MASVALAMLPDRVLYSDCPPVHHARVSIPLISMQLYAPVMLFFHQLCLQTKQRCILGGRYLRYDFKWISLYFRFVSIQLERSYDVKCQVEYS